MEQPLEQPKPTGWVERLRLLADALGTGATLNEVAEAVSERAPPPGSNVGAVMAVVSVVVDTDGGWLAAQSNRWPDPATERLFVGRIQAHDQSPGPVLHATLPVIRDALRATA